ncbi:MAG: 50S ribosomal protein L29 [Parcubacteria group bacterium]|nr:50S ribosomal protein L29 [Parcubacteria group bacterium]
MSEYTYKQLKEMSKIQLERLAAQLRHEEQTLTFSAGLNELKQVHKIGEARQTLARVMSLLGAAAQAKGETVDKTTKAGLNDMI